MTTIPSIANTPEQNFDTIANFMRLFQDRIFFGYGTPESNVVAEVGAIYLRSDGGAGTSFYVKESGSAATGWAAK